jgi:hypothetical protein
VSRTGLALVAGLLAALPALAQQAPPAPAAPGAPPASAAPAAGAAASGAADRTRRAAAQRQPAKNASEIVLVNARQAAVSGLSVTSAAGKEVAKLKKPLEPGKRIAIRLPKNSGCTFSVNAAFADDAEFDQTDVNLCADKTIRFVD